MAHTNKIESPSGTEHGRREMLHSGYSPAPGWTQLKSWHALPDFFGVFEKPPQRQKCFHDIS